MAKLYKLVVFVPVKYLEPLRAALCAAGAGQLGKKYDHCTFSTIGTGTFRPLKGAKPFIGKTGKFARVKEARLETIVLQTKLKQVIATLKHAHPYEVPAFEVYRIEA
jgi:hypothetical protein